MGDGLLLPAVAVSVAVLVLLAVLAGSVRRGRKRPGLSARQPAEPGAPRFSAYLIEEEIPASEYGRPPRWVEVTRDAERVDAERRLAELMRANPRVDYRLVSLTDRSTPARSSPAVTAPAAAPTLPAHPRQEIPQMTFTPVPADAPLWQRLRYHARSDDVTGVVAQRLYVRILGPRGTDPMHTGDRKLVPFFLQPDGSLIDRDRLERHMSHFLMAALGGPKRYTGRSMAAAHAGRWITDEAFDRVLGHVVAVLRELGVPEEWIGEVGRAVAPLREAVVTASVGAN